MNEVRSRTGNLDGLQSAVIAVTAVILFTFQMVMDDSSSPVTVMAAVMARTAGNLLSHAAVNSKPLKNQENDSCDSNDSSLQNGISDGPVQDGVYVALGEAHAYDGMEDGPWPNKVAVKEGSDDGDDVQAR
jgi:hypothetical protein